MTTTNPVHPSPSSAGSTRLLSDAAYAKIAREVAKYPPDQKQAAVMASLTIAQQEKGWMSPEVVEDVAKTLGMPPIAVHEVATFYTMYNTQPIGRFKLTVCTNLPCALRHADRAGQYLQRTLGVGYGETTTDGMFSLREGECMGACADAPVLLVNDTRMESFCDEVKLDALLDELRAKAPGVNPGNRVDVA
jgi:NADH-quinone oxidoreductase subunit E